MASVKKYRTWLYCIYQGVVSTSIGGEIFQRYPVQLFLLPIALNRPYFFLVSFVWKGVIHSLFCAYTVKIGSFV